MRNASRSRDCERYQPDRGEILYNNRRGRSHCLCFEKTPKKMRDHLAREPITNERMCAIYRPNVFDLDIGL